MIVVGALQVTCFGFLIIMLVPNKEQIAKKAKIKKSKKERFDALSRADQVKEISGVGDFKVYKETIRESGHGPVRIGEALDLDGDIYSMLFVLCIRPEYHFYYMKIAGKEFDLLPDAAAAAPDAAVTAPDAAAPDATVNVSIDKSNAEEDLRRSTIVNMYGKLPDQTRQPKALVEFAKQILETRKVINKSFSEIISQALVIWIFQITICGLIFNETREI